MSFVLKLFHFLTQLRRRTSVLLRPVAGFSQAREQSRSSRHGTCPSLLSLPQAHTLGWRGHGSWSPESPTGWRAGASGPWEQPPSGARRVGGERPPPTPPRVRLWGELLSFPLGLEPCPPWLHSPGFLPSLSHFLMFLLAFLLNQLLNKLLTFTFPSESTSGKTQPETNAYMEILFRSSSIFSSQMAVALCKQSVMSASQSPSQ